MQSFQRAMQLHQSGRLAEAEAAYRDSLAANPDHFETLHFFGLLEAQRGHMAEAEQLMGRSLKVNAGVADAFVNYARVLHELGRAEDALTACDRALALNPRTFPALAMRGNALRDLGRLEDALASIERAIALKPDFFIALSARGDVLRKLGRHEDALASYRQALTIKPDFAEAWCNQGAVLHDFKQYEEALSCQDHALKARPNFAQALCNRGATLNRLERYDEALAAYDQALTCDPRHAEALYNRAITLTELGRLDEALAAYRQSLAIAPDAPDAQWTEGLLDLLRGDLATGLVKYELRWQTRNYDSKPPAIAAPTWQGEDLTDRSILIFCEQGLGDIIQFARYLPKLTARGARVTLLCPAHIARLLRPLTAAVTVINDVPTATFDFHCALMSLPHRFGTELSSIPSAASYLEAERELAARWKSSIGTDGFRIGIAWQGNPSGLVDRGRSIPLDQFIPLSRIPGVRLISLQMRHGLDQLARLPADVHIETLGENFDSGPDAFIDTAAVMANLDLVITSDTSIAHLAGALGRPTWVALKSVPDWRWLLERRDSPWYPTLRLFRQSQRGDWTTVFTDMAHELQNLTTTQAATSQAGG